MISMSIMTTIKTTGTTITRNDSVCIIYTMNAMLSMVIMKTLSTMHKLSTMNTMSINNTAINNTMSSLR